MSKPSEKKISSLENEILSNETKLYTYDDEYQEKYLKSRPWEKDDMHFKKVFISTLAAMKTFLKCMSSFSQGRNLRYFS